MATVDIKNPEISNVQRYNNSQMNNIVHSSFPKREKKNKGKGKKKLTKADIGTPSNFKWVGTCWMGFRLRKSLYLPYGTASWFHVDPDAESTFAYMNVQCNGYIYCLWIQRFHLWHIGPGSYIPLVLVLVSLREVLIQPVSSRNPILYSVYYDVYCREICVGRFQEKSAALHPINGPSGFKKQGGL